MNIRNASIFSKAMVRHILVSGFLEFGPVLLFLASFERMTIYESTVVLMVATIISTIATYRLQKRIPYLALYVALITSIFGYMTIHFHAIKFLQMRDTLYDVTCALTLILGLIFNIPFLKIAFHSIIPMTDRAWERLTDLWIGYFLITALSNELVRRIFTLDDWFLFKGVVVVTTSLFGFFALYHSYESLHNKEGDTGHALVL